MDPLTDDTPWWTVWTAPARIPDDIADGLVRLITLPIQRGYRGGPPGTHPLLSFERFIDMLRRLFLVDRVPLPSTPQEAEHMLQQLLKLTVADPNERTLSEAAAAIRWLADVPLNERIIYFCPRREVHFL